MSFFNSDASDGNLNVNLPFNFVCDRYASPEALISFIIFSFKASKSSDVFRARAKTNQSKSYRRENFPIFGFFNPVLKRFASRICSRILQSNLPPEIAHHEPEFQRAKTPTELNAVIHLIRDGFGNFQIFRHKRKCLFEQIQIFDIQNRKIKRREKPFVRIRDNRIGAFRAFKMKLQFRQNHRASGISRVNVQKNIFAFANIGDFLQPDQHSSSKSCRRLRRRKTAEIRSLCLLQLLRAIFPRPFQNFHWSKF